MEFSIFINWTSPFVILRFVVFYTFTPILKDTLLANSENPDYIPWC